MPDLLVPATEPTALQEARNLARGSAAITVPAPTGGLNRREAEADMPLDQATRLANLVPEAQRVRKRGGYRTHVHLGIDHDPVIDTVPPQLAVPPPLFVLPGGQFFERPLLVWLEAQYEPINFELVEQLPEWLEIARHGVLYGNAPILPQDRTFQAVVRATDPALNHLLFDVNFLVLTGRPPPDLEAPTLVAFRRRATEPDVQASIGAVADILGAAKEDRDVWATRRVILKKKNGGWESHICRRMDEVMAFGHPNLEPLDYAQYTLYTPEMGEGGGHFNWHVDSRGGKADGEPPHLAKRVLSGSLVLEGSEEGGALEIEDTPVAPQTAGSAILFPSLNTSHRVTPVTRGCRVSLVAWAYEWRHLPVDNPFVD